MKKFILYVILICGGVFGISSTIIASAIDDGKFYMEPYTILLVVFMIMFLAGLVLSIIDIVRDNKKNIQLKNK